MRALPLEEWHIKLSSSGSLLVATHEHCGYLHWRNIALRDEPDNLASVDDLKGFGIKISDITAIAESQPFRAASAR